MKITFLFCQVADNNWINSYLLPVFFSAKQAGRVVLPMSGY